MWLFQTTARKGFDPTTSYAQISMCTTLLQGSLPEQNYEFGEELLIKGLAILNGHDDFLKTGNFVEAMEDF